MNELMDNWVCEWTSNASRTLQWLNESLLQWAEFYHHQLFPRIRQKQSLQKRKIGKRNCDRKLVTKNNGGEFQTHGNFFFPLLPVYDNLVQESTFCAIIIKLIFYPRLISSKMLYRKLLPSSSMVYYHKWPLNLSLPDGIFKKIFLPFWLQIQIPGKKKLAKETIFLFPIS